MDWKLEAVQIPLSDVDRAKAFYTDQLGFSLDIDDQISEDMRLVQLTPSGSGCSIHLRKDAVHAGSMEGLLMVVGDIHAARRALVERRVDASEVQEFDRESGTYRSLTHEPGWNAFVFFHDPDGNGWVVQHRGT
jgi:catechol 2,3-dioxygenase-like lactoylglutathione lyase family enzyme